MSKQWAVRCELTGDYYEGHGRGWEQTGHPLRFDRYAQATGCVALSEGHARHRDTARIVEAPPPEMTDTEAWEWLRMNGSCRFSLAPAYGNADEHWFVQDSHDAGANPAYGATPEDAIRAARRILEVKR